MNATAVHPLGENVNACTGCAACASACPKNAIIMQPDAEGFLHPQIDSAVCTDSGLCRKTCPVGRKEDSGETRSPGEEGRNAPRVFAAWHLDETIRRESSSGGVFTALAQNILARGGVVVGAAFDHQFVVRHTLIETSADLRRLRGSKYVQSEVSAALYRQIHGLLNQGRTVLFSGTPCQVAGLRYSTRQPSANLFCCDLVCIGVPSPLLLALYGRYNQSRGNQLAKVSFRDKAAGWKTWTVRQHLRNGESRLYSLFADPYMAAFCYVCNLRPSCYACKFASTTRTGDLTIADFWGVAQKYPEYDRDDRGTSLVLQNTEKGLAWLDACRKSIFLGPADIDTAIAGNPMLVRPCPRPPERDTFYRDLQALSFPAMIRKYHLHTPSLLSRVKAVVKRKTKGACRRAIRAFGFAEGSPS